MSLRIAAIPALRDNYIYALIHADGRCAIVDPGSAEPVRQFLRSENLRLGAILCTHHHHDHVAGVPELVDQFDVPVWTSRLDHARIPHASQVVGEGASYEILDEELYIFDLPGHTLGQIAYYLPQQAALFAGDTLFSCGCGRLFEGTFEQMFVSLQKIAKLPPNTQLYFGHEYTLRNLQFLTDSGVESPALARYREACESKPVTTPGNLRTELELSPFLQAKTVAEFRAWRERRDKY